MILSCKYSLKIMSTFISSVPYEQDSNPCPQHASEPSIGRIVLDLVDWAEALPERNCWKLKMPINCVPSLFNYTVIVLR